MCIFQDRIDHELDVTRAPSRQQTHIRNRSQSPAYLPRNTSARSRSLSSRRPDNTTLPPSGRYLKDNPDITSDRSRIQGHSRFKGRRSSIPHVKWKQQKQTNNHYNQNHIGSDLDEGMNGESLPPIHSNRSESALSKRSSRESVASASGSIPKGTVFRYEKPCLINVDSPVSQQADSPNHLSRSHLSPASFKSESSGNSKGGRHSGNPAATGLETLFEQKNSTANNQLEGESYAVEESAIDSGYNSYNHTNTYKNMKFPSNQRRGSLASNTLNSFPSKERRGSVASSNVNGMLTSNKRTQSISNITNQSDNSKEGDSFKANGTKSKPATMHRIRSENVLSVPMSQDRTVSPRTGRPLRTTNSPSQSKQNNNNNTKPFSRTVSHPALLSQQNDTELNARNIKKNSNKRAGAGGQRAVVNGGQADDGSDGEKNDRIVEWLIGVESAEPPPTPEISEEEPSQTDTAIHVVYNGE